MSSSDETIKFYSIPEAFPRDTSSEAEEVVIKMSKARGLLHLDLPFFGFLLTQLEIYPVVNDYRINSFAMDTRRMYIKAEFFREMTTAKIREYLLHAIIHLVMKHGDRSVNKNIDTWGLSCDINAHRLIKETLYENNLYLGSNQNQYDFEDLKALPSTLYDKSAEEIDTILYNYANKFLKPEERRVPPSKKRFNEEIMSEVMNYTSLGEACNYIENFDELTGNISPIMQKMENDRFMGLIKYAYDHAKKQGKIPGHLNQYIEDIINPKIPWYNYLEQYIQRSLVTDYKWTPPNRRFVHQDLYLPSTEKENIDVVIALDTSGSIGKEELQAFLGECFSIFNSFGNISMTVIQCDYIIQNVVRIEAGENIDGGSLPWENSTVYGRGGTSFVPVFDHIKENEINASILIYFTDGYGEFPQHSPEYDIYWIMTTNIDPPFGEVIRYDAEP